MNYTEQEIRGAVELMMAIDEATHNSFHCFEQDLKFAAVEMFVNEYLERLPFDSNTYICLGFSLHNDAFGQFFLQCDDLYHMGYIYSIHGIIDIIYQIIKINS